MATAADSGKSRGECELCQDTGTMSWQQPSAAGVLRVVEMPCPQGCGGYWKHPHAERDRVVEQPRQQERQVRVRGNADEANRIGAGFIAEALRRGITTRPHS